MPLAMLMLLATVMAAGPVSRAHAVAPRVPPANQVVTLSPVVIERTVERGMSATATVKVFNQTETTRTFAAGFEDFAASEDPDVDKEWLGEQRAARGARDWAAVDVDRFTLAPGAERALEVTLTVPSDASVGGHYVALWVADRTTASGNIAVVSRSAVLFLLTVDGPLEHDVTVSLERRRALVVGGPASFALVVRNRGTVHEDVQPQVALEALLGRETTPRVRPMIVLPGATRRTVVRTSTPWFPDVHTARVSLGKGSSPHARVTDEQATTLRVPLWVLIVAAAIVVLAFVLWLRRPRPGDEVGDESHGHHP